MQGRISLTVSCLLMWSVVPGTARAFAEDVCFAEGGGLVNCAQTRCRPGDESPRCQWAAVLGYAQGTTVSVGGRSSIHTDATYYLAQAVGLDAGTAYWIAAYNEATDLGQYVPYSKQGYPLVDVSQCGSPGQPPGCDQVTANINGVTRMNMPSGGLLMHFLAPYNPEGAHVDGLHPNVQGEGGTEHHLKNLRAWVYEQGTACVAGLTDPEASTPACEDSSLSVEGEIPVLSSGGAVPMSAGLGEQPVQTHAALPSVPASNLGALTGPLQVRAARMGIYLHSLQDRISHHRCSDASTYLPPAAPGANHLVDFDPEECSQTVHALRHSWETGTLQATLPLEDQTTQPALEQTYDELLAFAEHLGRASPKAYQPAYRARVIQDLLRAIERPQASGRVQGMVEAMNALGLTPMPGH